MPSLYIDATDVRFDATDVKIDASHVFIDAIEETNSGHTDDKKCQHET